MAMAHDYGSWLMALTLLSAEIVFLHSCLNFRTRLPVLIQSPLIYFPGREILEAAKKKKKKRRTPPYSVHTTYQSPSIPAASALTGLGWWQLEVLSMGLAWRFFIIFFFFFFINPPI